MNTGYFGIYGGRFVPETLMPALLELEAAYAAARSDDAFLAELNHLLATYVGRPSALTRADRLATAIGTILLAIYLPMFDMINAMNGGPGH